MAKFLEKINEAPEKVAIFWDYENCAPSNNVSGYTLVAKIRQIALKFGHITSFRAYLELSDTSPKSVNLRSELQTSSVSLIDCPHSGRKDVADKMMIVDMLAFAIDNPSPATVILISGDRDFAYAVSTLQNRGYAVILIVPTASHVALKAQATQIFDWFDIVPVPQSDPMFSPKLHTGSLRHERDSSSGTTFQYPSTSSSPVIPFHADEPAITGTPAPFPGAVVDHMIPPQIIPSLPYGVNSRIDGRVTESPAPIQNNPAPISLQRSNSVPLPHLQPSPKATVAATPGKTTLSSRWTLSGKPIVVLPHIEVVLNLLEEYRKVGMTTPLRSHVGEALLKRDRQIYVRAGVSKFKDYIATVAAAGLVRLGGQGGAEFVTLLAKRMPE